MKVWRVGATALSVALALCELAVAGPVVTLDGYHNNEAQMPKHYRWEATDLGGYSQLAAIIQDLSAQLRTLRERITAKTLQGVDVFIIVDPDTAAESKDPKYISDEEINALDSWVQAGGRLVMLGNDQGNSEFEHWNLLAARFGVKFLESTFQDADGKSHGIYAMSPRAVLGANLYAYLVKAAPLEITNPDAVIWLRSGTTPLMAYVPRGKGAVVALGDPWVYNEYIDSGDNRQLATHLFKALLSGGRLGGLKN